MQSFQLLHIALAALRIKQSQGIRPAATLLRNFGIPVEKAVQILVPRIPRHRDPTRMSGPSI